MESVLEKWQECRRRYFQDEKDGAAASCSVRTFFLQRMLWWTFEFLVTWMLIFSFSLWYLFDYASMRILIWRTRRVGDGCLISTSSSKNPSLLLPATCLGQTREQQESPDYWKNLWKEMDDFLSNHGESDEQLIEHIRSNLRVRHVASLLLCKEASSTSLAQVERQQRMRSILHRIWPRILELPSPDTSPHQHTYAISLIIPAYKESRHQIQDILDHTLDRCQNPSTIQVIIVQAGDPTEHDNLNGIEPSPVYTFSWGTEQYLPESPRDHVQVLSYSGTRGRGGCLNYGAAYAQGRILTFLHADTYLPPRWDVSIQSALASSSTTRKQSTTAITTTLCAFTMGIDMSHFSMGLWGADHILGYIRSSICQLPYGDSVLSLPRHIFHYIGGYPDQPLMEDWELVQLLRKRSLARWKAEQIQILPDRIACSPRRWEQHGVAYVILSNAYCIYRYRQQQTPSEDLYDFYYGSSTTRRTHKQQQQASSSGAAVKED